MKNHGLSDSEKAAAQLCVFGRGLVLGHGAVSGERRDESDGDGKYLLSS